uniref:Secreted protein n=1 Tax=Steinernema glaseri TaxID=37863 RepID=A0A1I7ZSZ7_9BILA
MTHSLSSTALLLLFLLRISATSTPLPDGGTSLCESRSNDSAYAEMLSHFKCHDLGFELEASDVINTSINTMLPTVTSWIFPARAISLLVVGRALPEPLRSGALRHVRHRDPRHLGLPPSGLLLHRLHARRHRHSVAPRRPGQREIRQRFDPRFAVDRIKSLSVEKEKDREQPDLNR